MIGFDYEGRGVWADDCEFKNIRFKKSRKFWVLQIMSLTLKSFFAVRW